MKYQIRLLLIACIVVFTTISSMNCHPTLNTTEECDCASAELVSTGGIEEMYPRYTGNWYIVGDYDSFPLYMCLIDCQGLSDKLVSHNFLSNFFIQKFKRQRKVKSNFIPSYFMKIDIPQRRR